MYPDTHGLSIGEREGVYRVVLNLGSGSSKRS